MTSDQSPRVVAYARVSTDNQLENYSIDEQVSRLTAYCTAKGWTLLQTYIDGGYSGGNTNRPALNQLLEAVSAGGIEAVLVYKLDRLSRSQKDTLTLIEDAFLAKGTNFVSINENFDTSTPFGRAMIGILSVFAQLEKDQITERFTMGRIGRGKAGYFHGGGSIPTGYNYIGGHLLVNDYEAAQVQQAFCQFLAGSSINAVQRTLSEQYTTKWTATKVRNVLKNSLYIGKVKFLGQTYPGAHMPIIDLPTYEAANHLLDSFGHKTKTDTGQKSPFRAGYLLSGLVVCGSCGANYTANHGYYKCCSRAKSSPARVLDPNCKNKNWSIEDLDALVCHQVDTLVATQIALTRLLSEAEQQKPVADDTYRLAKRISELDAQLEKLIELYQISALPMEALTRKASNLAREKASLLETINAPAPIHPKALLQSALDDYNAAFAAGTTDRKRALFSALIDRISVTGQLVRVFWRL